MISVADNATIISHDVTIEQGVIRYCNFKTPGIACTSGSRTIPYVICIVRLPGVHVLELPGVCATQTGGTTT